MTKTSAMPSQDRIGNLADYLRTCTRASERFKPTDIHMMHSSVVLALICFRDLAEEDGDTKTVTRLENFRRRMFDYLGKELLGAGENGYAAAMDVVAQATVALEHEIQHAKSCGRYAQVNQLFENFEIRLENIFEQLMAKLKLDKHVVDPKNLN